jgi:hypothetical protein
MVSGLESRGRPKASARLDLEVSVGLVSPSSRGLVGVDHALLLSTGAELRLGGCCRLSPTHLHRPLEVLQRFLHIVLRIGRVP